MARRLRFKVLVISTVIILFTYAAIYTYYSRDLTKPCEEQGGVCKAGCGFGETEIDTCGDLECCVPIRMAAASKAIAMAVKQRDILLCTSAEENFQKQCKVMVLDAISADQALKYNDVKYCNSILDTPVKEKCYASLAQKTGNLSLCGLIGEDARHDSCYIWFAERRANWGICTDLVNPDFHRDICLKEVAIITKDVAICSQVSMESESADCRLKVDIALNIQNNVDCAMLTKDECLTAKGCRQILINDPLEDLKDAYGGCARDEKYFCLNSKGKWAETGSGLYVAESCDCGERVYYDGYGCFSCEKFMYARDECLRKLERQQQASGGD